MDFLKGLNAQQREAVSHIDGPLLILAGAGSGKTSVITHRIAHIITTRHVPPSSVLAVTFTNKAAREMRERVDSLLEDVPLDSAPNLSTFHSFCVRMLRRDGDPLARVRPGFTRRFSIYDDEDQLVIIKAAYRTLGLEEKEFMQTARRSKICTPEHEDYRIVQKRSTKNRHHRRAVRAIRGAAHYQRAGFRRPPAGAVRLLQLTTPRAEYNRRLSYVMIDEYQDTNYSDDLMRS
jgi:DNA helicase-2/ATP-dependent DNA helicase PcrA